MFFSIGEIHFIQKYDDEMNFAFTRKNSIVNQLSPILPLYSPFCYTKRLIMSATKSTPFSNSFYTLLSLPSTAMGFALCVQIATLSWILNSKYGLNIESISYVWLAGPVAGILGQIIVGRVSDNVWFWGGRRRPFIVVGGIIAALMILALPYLDVIQGVLGIGLVATALIVALTLDLAINVSLNPARSIIADVTPQGEKRTKGYTWMQTVSGFFGVMAYLMGAFISNYFLIYFGVLFVFICAVFPAFFIKEPRQLESTKEELELLDQPVSTKEDTTDWTNFLKLCGANFFTWLGVQVMFINTFAYIKEIIMGFETTAKLSETQNNEIGFGIGIAFAILNTVGFILPALVLEPISKKIGRVKTHVGALLIMTLGYGLLVLFGNTMTQLFVLMAIVGVGWSAIVSLPFAIMSDMVDSRKMGYMMGLFNLSVVFPQICASLLGGYIEHQPDKNTIFIISAISLGISAVLWLLVKEKQKK